jgi:hypothetical protein
LLSLAAATALSASADAAQERVYLLRGGPIDIQHPSVFQAGRDIDAYLKRVSPRANFKSLHNSAWRTVVSEIVSGKKSGTVGAVTLIGHSFGVPAAIRTARALGERGIRVKRIVSVDARQGAWKMRGDTVPDNVGSFVNFYETSSGLPGTTDFRRPDGSRRGVVNKPVVMRGAFRHSRLLGKVVDDELLTASLSGKNPGGAFDGVLARGRTAPSTRAPAPVRVPEKRAKARDDRPLVLKPRKSFVSRRVPNPRVEFARTQSRKEAKAGWKKAGVFGWLIGAFRGYWAGFRAFGKSG